MMSRSCRPEKIGRNLKPWSILKQQASGLSARCSVRLGLVVRPGIASGLDDQVLAMPIYEYQCENCGYAFEVLRRMRDADDALECPKCESPSVQRQLSTFAAGGCAVPPPADSPEHANHGRVGPPR
jgi:putative FmdB family regulatory protein